MQDHKIIHKQLETFFRDQQQGIEKRAYQGGPVGDIISALTEIKKVLPKLNDKTSLEDWLISAQEVLTTEKLHFRREQLDEAGWGVATFTELSDNLYLLKKEYRC